MDRLHYTVVTVMVVIPRVAAGHRRMGGWAGLTAFMKKETIGEMERVTSEWGGGGVADVPYVLNLLYFEGCVTMVQPVRPFPPQHAQIRFPPRTDCTQCSRM